MSAPTTERDPFKDATLSMEEVAEIQAAFDKDDYDTLDIEALLVSHERFRAQCEALLGAVGTQGDK